MTPVNLAHIDKNPKSVRADLDEWSKANPAEVIETMQRRGELKNLKAPSYDRAYKPRVTVQERIPDATEGHGFKVGDRVKVTKLGMAAVALAGLPQKGKVTGVHGPFIRVGSELYAPDRWEKA